MSKMAKEQYNLIFDAIDLRGCGIYNAEVVNQSGHANEIQIGRR